MTNRSEFMASYSAADYQRERALLDSYNEWARQFLQPNGWTVIPAGTVAPGELATVDNAMRSRVERFQLFSDAPDSFVAYIGKPQGDGMGQTWTVTTWTGDVICHATRGAVWRTPHSYVSSTMAQFYCLLGGREYTGRGAGEGMSIHFRETAASKRARALGHIWNGSRFAAA